jgi:hypothetical protein
MLCSASVASGALLIRDPPACAGLSITARDFLAPASVGPGSAVHHCVLHRARDTPVLTDRQKLRAPRNDTYIYIRSRRLALPLRILALSSSHSGTVSIHCVPGMLAMNGQSTA